MAGQIPGPDSTFTQKSKHSVMGKTSIPTTDDHHFRREDRVLRWQRIAGHIAEHPTDLSIALENTSTAG